MYEYGITLEHYNNMLEQQQNRCAICPEVQSDDFNALSVDHDHKTGQIRGLLCNSCNRGLGFFRDDIALLKKAIEYLERNTSH